MTTLTALKHMVRSKLFGKVFFTVGILLVTITVFEAGVMVGFRKASYSYSSSNYYFENLEGPRERPMGIRDRDFMSGHGAVGKIIKIDPPSLIVETPEGVEKTIYINDKTTIRRFKDTVTAENLRLDDFVIILGSPSEKGVISARFIRVTPPPNNLISSSKERQ